MGIGHLSSAEGRAPFSSSLSPACGIVDRGWINWLRGGILMSQLATTLANFGDVFGLPVDTPHTRRYAFGAVPIGDDFLAWSKSARPGVAPAQTGLTPRVSAGGACPC